MIDRRGERITGGMGLAAVVLAVGALSTWGNPQPTDPLSKITSYYVQNQHEVFLSQYLIVLFGLAALVFAAGLRPILSRAEGGLHLLAPLVLGVAVLNAVWMMVWGAINDGLALEAGQASAGTLRLLIGIENSVDGMTGYSMGLLPLVAGLAMVRGRVFAPWIAWLGFVSGSLCVIGEVSFLDPNGALGNLGNLAFLGQLLFLIWMIAVGVSLLRRSPTQAIGRQAQRQAESLPA